MDDPFTESFTPLIGCHGWSVERGHGSMLSLQFGEPCLAIREPFVSASPLSETLASAARRHVEPVRAWCLWVSCCRWRALASGTVLAEDDSDHDQIEAVARSFEGQRLVEFGLDRAARRATFGFDRGAALETDPYAKDDGEMWSLYRPDGRVLSYRADGAASLDPGDTPPDRVTWRPVERGVTVSSS